MTRQAAGRQESTKARKQGIEKNGVREFNLNWRGTLPFAAKAKDGHPAVSWVRLETLDI